MKLRQEVRQSKTPGRLRRQVPIGAENFFCFLYRARSPSCGFFPRCPVEVHRRRRCRSRTERRRRRAAVTSGKKACLVGRGAIHPLCADMWVTISPRLSSARLAVLASNLAEQDQTADERRSRLPRAPQCLEVLAPATLFERRGLDADDDIRLRAIDPCARPRWRC